MNNKGVASILVILIILALSTALSTTLIKVAEELVPKISENIAIQCSYSGNEIEVVNTYPLALPISKLKITVNGKPATILEENPDGYWSPFEKITIHLPSITSNTVTIVVTYDDKVVYQAVYVKPKVLKGDKTPPKITFDKSDFDVNSGHIFFSVSDDNGVVEYGIQFGYLNGTESKPILRKVVRPSKHVRCDFQKSVLTSDYLFRHEVACLIIYAKDVAGNPSRVIVPLPPPPTESNFDVIPLYPAQWKIVGKVIRIPSDKEKASVNVIIDARSQTNIKVVILYVNGNVVFKSNVGKTTYHATVKTTLDVGQNKIMLKVINSYGVKNRVEKVVKVVKDSPPVINQLKVLPGKGCLLVDGKIVYSQPLIPVKFQINAFDDVKIVRIVLSVDGSTIYATTPNTNTVNLTTREYSFRSGTHTLKVDVYDDYNQKTTTTVTFETDYDKPPEITFTPTVEYARPSGREIHFTATATDDYGLKSISVTINGKTFEKHSSGRVLSLSDSTFLKLGSYPVSVKALDLFRTTTKTFVLVVKPDYPPSVRIVKPKPSETVVRSRNVKVSAFASDDREVKYVAIYVDGKKVGEIHPNSKSYTFTTTVTLDYGYHYAKAEACDEFGCVESEIVPFYVKEDYPPYVKITYPYDGQTFEIMRNSVTIPVSVYARDDVKVVEITLKIDGRTVATERYSSLVATLSEPVSLNLGIHTITAIAKDSSGKTSRDSVTIYVKKVVTAPEIKAFSIPEIGWYKDANSAYVIGG